MLCFDLYMFSLMYNVFCVISLISCSWNGANDMVKLLFGMPSWKYTVVCKKDVSYSMLPVLLVAFSHLWC